MVTRIRQLLDSKQLTPTQFADQIGVGRPVMSHILSERNKPSLEVVQRIISAFPEISLPWLLSGTGNMLAESLPATADSQPSEELLPIATPSAPMLSIPEPLPATAAPTAPAVPSSAVPPVQSPLPLPAPSALKPSRAARFVPTAPAPAKGPTATPPVPASRSLPASAPVADVSVPSAAPTSLPAAIVAGPPPEAAALSLLSEPGKAIRRIVIFYRDGSFADYQPEA
ncbi:MAG: helix-turn-helix domain-containing protein [Janthinobacterium lividum]